MSVFERLFGSRQQRRDAERARQIIEAAFLKSREPKTCAEAAASGADTRDRLLTVVEEIEKGTSVMID
jgi:broad specificity phosphatase PhoE